MFVQTANLTRRLTPLPRIDIINSVNLMELVMSIECKVTEMVIATLREQYVGRHVTHTTPKPWHFPWRIHNVDELGGTHIVVDAGFYFSTHYCPSTEEYSLDSGVRSYECYLVVKNVSSNEKTTIYYDLGDL